jgi:hypothetical protein
MWWMLSGYPCRFFGILSAGPDLSNTSNRVRRPELGPLVWGGVGGSMFPCRLALNVGSTAAVLENKKKGRAVRTEWRRLLCHRFRLYDDEVHDDLLGSIVVNFYEPNNL